MHKHILLITFMVIASMNIWAQIPPVDAPICIPVVKSVGDQINQVVVSGSDGSGIFVWQELITSIFMPKELAILSICNGMITSQAN